MLAYPDVPNHQSWVPNYAKAKSAWQAFQNKYRAAAGVDIDADLATLKTTLQGIFDETAPVKGSGSSSTGPLGVPPGPRGPTLSGLEPQPAMTATTEELVATRPTRPTTLVHAPPSGREAIWGFIFIGPWLIGLVLLTAGPMIASLVLSLTDFNLVRPEAIKFVGFDNYVRMATGPQRPEVAGRDLPVRGDRHPPDDGRQPRLRAAA